MDRNSRVTGDKWAMKTPGGGKTKLYYVQLPEEFTEKNDVTKKRRLTGAGTIPVVGYTIQMISTNSPALFRSALCVSIRIRTG